ncbi:MAG: carboxypeptidase regulatory-like domain-containing protein [Acidobacteriota bacterium]
MRYILTFFLISFSLFISQIYAQDPFGSIEGTVKDPQGSVVQNATVVIKNTATNASRTATSNQDGNYRVLQLQPGTYEIKVSASGFKQSLLDHIQVQVGQVASADIGLQIGGASETVTVTPTVEAQIERSDNAVSGVVNTRQIENLPLNGRNFLDLAQLQPGTEKVEGASIDPTKANFTGVSIGGQAGRSTQITVDGGSVVDNVVGTTVQNFSQEIVQEFQIGLSNFSLATGASASGSVNIVSRSGSNQFHGNAFGYFRDDSFAAFPALDRLDTAHGIPLAAQATRIPFDRQQFGGTLGGRLIKDKLFFFGSYERNNQNGSSIFNPTPTPSFAGFGPNPFDEVLFTGKLDWVVSDRASAFFRYSFNRNTSQGPFPSGSGILPRPSVSGIFGSDDQNVINRSHGFVAGLNYALSNNISNNFVANYGDFLNAIDPVTVGVPEIQINPDRNFRSGANSIAPQRTQQKRLQFRDDLTWVKGNHIITVGGDYERSLIGGEFVFANPGRIRLFAPATEPLTEADFLNLPVNDISFGVGDPNLPFNNNGKKTLNSRFQIYGGDAWKIRPNLTLNYGVAYRWDSNLWNTDLSRPAVIAPLFENGTAAPKRDNNNIAPRVGFAWNPFKNGKTIVRGGFGVYYDNTIDNLRLFERADLGPVGAEQFLVRSAVVSNLLNQFGGDGLFGQVGEAVPTLSQILAILPAVRADLESRLTNCTLPTALECTGQVSGPIFSSKFQVPYSLQYSIGVQHELPWNMLLQVDYNYRKGLNEVQVFDINQADSAAGPRLGAAFTSPVPYADSSAFSTYSAILARVDRRFSNGLQFTASYSLSRFKAFSADALGLAGAPTDLNNLRADFGPAGLDRTNRFVLSGIYELPFYKNSSSAWKRNTLGNWTVSMISTTFSGLPQSVFLADNLDLSGTGTFTSYLPGTGPGSIGRSIKNVSQLNSLIQAFNQNFAGRTDGLGQDIRALAELPSDTPIGGDSILSQDLRLTKTINFNEKFRLQLIGEVFNLFNFANLTNVNDLVIPAQADTLDPSFSFTTLRPSQRANSVFGTGGPRAFQFGARLTF